MATTSTQPRTVSVEDAARILGIGRSLAYQLANDGQIPTLRLGRRLLVPRARLDALLGETPNAAAAREDKS